MKYDGKWFGDHLGKMTRSAFKKEVDSSFAGDPDKDKKIAELFALFQLTQENGNNSKPAAEISKS